MLKFYDFFNEVHWQDIYPDSFREFRKKYGKILREKNGYNLYVQFTNHKSDLTDRSIHSSPDHHDPAGNYAYHLKYAIEHPADIWYGRSAKFLRVLQDISKNKIRINELTENQASTYLYKMGFHSSDLDYARKKFKFKGATAVGKSFFAVIQYDLATTDEEGNPTLRDQSEQRRLLLKAGIDAIEDNSRTNKQAVINEREPEQIVFLTSQSFKVVEIFNLHPESKNSLSYLDPTDRQKRKLVSQLLYTLDGDKIASSDGNSFWSVKGRKVEVSFEITPSHMQNKKLGEKKHKQYKLHDQHFTTLILNSEKGKFGGRYSADVKFEDIIREIASNWREAKEVVGWQHDSLQKHKEREDKAKQEYLAKHAAEHKIKLAKEEQEEMPIISQVAAKMGITWRPNPNRDYNYAEILNSISRTSKKGIDWEEMDSNFNNLKKDGYDDGLLFSFGYLPKNLSSYPDLDQLRNIIKKLNPDLSYSHIVFRLNDFLRSDL